MSEASILKNLNLGSSKEALKGTPNSPLSQLIQEQVNSIIKDLRQRLSYYDADSSGELKQSLIISKVEQTTDAITVQMSGEFYWKFVNYGVNGTLINRGAPSYGTQPSTGRSFKDMINQWMGDRGITPRQGTSRESLNWLIRKDIIEDGQEKRPFFTDVVNNALERELTQQVTQLMGRAIEITILDPWQ